MPIIDLPPISTLLDWIESWQNCDLRSLDCSGVDKKICEIATELGYAGISLRHFSETTNFFRIRKIDNDNITVSDLWSPPKGKGNIGRCSSKKHPALYISTDSATPFEEMNATSEDNILLIKYRAIRRFSVVGVAPYIHELSESDDKLFGNDVNSHDRKQAWRLLTAFIRSEFMKPVGKGTEYLYKISESICRNWMSIKNTYGWSYSPVKNPTMENIAVKQEYEKKCLKVENAWIVRLRDFDSSIDKLKESSNYITTKSDSLMANFPDSRPILCSGDQKMLPIISKIAEFEGNNITWIKV